MSLTQDVGCRWIYAIKASTLLSVLLLTAPGFGQCSIEDTSGCPRREAPPVHQQPDREPNDRDHSNHQAEHTHISWWNPFDFRIKVDDGYQWKYGHCCEVVPVPDGTPSKKHRQVVWIDGRLQPADGYEWANNKGNDYRVVRISKPKKVLDVDSSLPFQRPARPDPKSLMDAIESAANSPGCTGKLSCNFFVGRVGLNLHIPYFQRVLTTEHPDHYLVNEMYTFVVDAVKSKASGWRQVFPQEAQELADQGKFVVGVARSVEPPPDHHGHIVVISPSSAKHNHEPGSGPWVRDGQNPKISCRASQRFGSDVVEPVYAVWEDPGVAGYKR